MSDIRYGNVKENSKDSKKVEIHHSSTVDESALNSLRPTINVSPQKEFNEANGIIDQIDTDRRLETADQLLAADSSRSEEPK